ncbi:MAG: lysoplasmalogenase [Bacteroidales bacterium]
MKNYAYLFFVLSALLFIWAMQSENLILYSITKPIPLIILILLVDRKTLYNKLILGGFVFSLIGDILLMRTVDLFVPGLIAFLTAHLFYIYAFWIKKPILKLITCFPFYLYGLLFFLYLNPVLGEMKIPVALYILVITTMLWRSFVQFNRDDKMGRWAFFGALLFVLSDSMIAVTKFIDTFYLSSIVIMTTYWGGQFLFYWSTTNPFEKRREKKNNP